MARCIMNKKSMGTGLVLALLVVCANLPQMQAAISCGTVSSDLAPCVPYVEGKVAAPSASCCGGVKSLYAATRGLRADRVTACKCIKSLLAKIPVKPANIADLPRKCGVSLGYSISPSTNCDTIP